MVDEPKSRSRMKREAVLRGEPLSDVEFDSKPTDFDPTKPNCQTCGSTGKMEYWKYGENGEVVEHGECQCNASGDTPEDIWNEAKFLLAQFIRCPSCKPFDPNDLDNETCDGCDYERSYILDHMWHYGEILNTKPREEILKLEEEILNCPSTHYHTTERKE